MPDATGIRLKHRKDGGEPPAYGAKAAFDMPSEGKDDKLPPSVFRRPWIRISSATLVY
ncbi:hypothetical protein NMA510612_1639 [Neisseria meningitidis]|uniref:Uncharacterized protein n=1 Tax=Neisseria meningitidis TaxID=487 RepID=X5EJT8_NEIME|nr:hypothetical protein NMA510612_1639 [Neisseria meningitidis]